ncbi:hypothetical protein QO009_002003 [Brevibacillus aydinogluensis]|uniref:hypothetical protein n=1 Tax=Brevibacillus aydinogluensis TaxID=927786 RepID=UPI0028930F11|nr:hypothetical protein [Brevibacillus aydinogluensis]MDT3416135.1 hypothetical protein [Brevibacillus aydinogluensis]
MRKPKQPLRIVSEKVVSQFDSTKVLCTRPEDNAFLVASCKAAWATMTTGEVHVVKRVVNE